MWNKPENPIPLGNLQLRLGVFVWIDRSWKEHPFLINKFRINTDEQLKQLLALGSVGIYWFPSKSTAEPGPAPSVPVPPPPVQSADTYKKKNDEVQRQRALSAKAEREWQQAAKLTREAMLGMRDAPKQAGTKMRELTKSAAQSVSSGDALLHMLGDKNEQGPQPDRYSGGCAGMDQPARDSRITLRPIKPNRSCGCMTLLHSHVLFGLKRRFRSA